MRGWIGTCFLLCASGIVSAQTVNGCTRATANDLTGQSQVTITFVSFAYTPKCAKVDLGSQVTFNGTFASHPLQGGTEQGGVLTPASSGPFIPVTNTGTSKSFTMSANGDFPYYCQNHGSFGMSGVVYVGPDPLPDAVFLDDFE